MRHQASSKMIKARALRMDGLTLAEIGKKLKITRQGARWLLMRSDDFMAPPKLGDLKSFKKFLSGK